MVACLDIGLKIKSGIKFAALFLFIPFFSLSLQSKKRTHMDKLTQKINDQIKLLNGNTDNISDGYHTFQQLYDFRREYNAALVNSGVWKAHKSFRHNDGELCFGGGWFIVMIETPFGQISNHYENKYWNEFHCQEKDVADKWDGHTEIDVLDRLKKCNSL